MTSELTFDPIRLPPECEALRAEVRAFLAEEIAAGSYHPDEPGNDHGFSRVQPQGGAEGLDRHDLAEALWRARAQLSRALRRDRGVPGRQCAGTPPLRRRSPERAGADQVR